MGLAEPKKKVKYSIDPNALHWANNEDKFGKRLMEKMGWQKGKGLGANEDGMTEHIKVKFKSDTQGIGFKNEYDNVWLDHQDEFESLLSNLSQNCANSSAKSEKSEEVKSLEERSKESRRLHYKKFAKSKDLSSVSANDLNCILGTQKRKLKASEDSSKISSSDSEDVDSFRPSFSQVDSKKNENDNEDKVEDNYGTKFNTNKLSVQDYFANKMASKINTAKNNSFESSISSDFKDSNEEIESESKDVNEENYAKKKKKKNKHKDDFELQQNNEEVENLNSDRRKNNKIEIPVNLVEINDSEENLTDVKIKKKKKKSKKSIESEGFNVSLTEQKTIIAENDDSKDLNGLVTDSLTNETEMDNKNETKKKKKSKTKDEQLNVSLNEESNQKPNDLDSLVKSSFKGSNLLSIYGYSAYYINSNLEEVINEKVKRLNRKRYLVNKKLEIDADYYKSSKKMNV